MVLTQPLTSTTRRAVELAIVAEGAASLTRSELTAARQQPIGRFSAILRPQFLKHSEEQSLAALAAVSNAIERFSLGDDFDAWAVVSATRYLGRAAFSAAISKYRVDGPWGVSVQVIPHTAPHAVASTLSLALRSHGPCFGAGAADGEESHALLAAATLLQRSGIPGAWIVFSGWSPASAVHDAGAPSSEAVCTATALAVIDAQSDLARPGGAIGRIRVDEGQTEGPPRAGLSELLVARREEISWRSASGSMRIAVDLEAIA